MSTSAAAVEPEAPDLVAEIDSVQGIVDALTSVRWKRHQVLQFLSYIFFVILPQNHLNLNPYCTYYTKYRAGIHISVIQ